MDIEELNKAQIILLTLLVSFVTSIATGIVTVTLLDQAPPAITQNINRVVERTVERVVPAEAQNPNTGGTRTETTIVVKESDLISESIDKNAKSLVRIIERGSGSDGQGTVIGLGIFITRGGLVATDGSIVTQGKDYAVRTSTGEVYNTSIQDAGPGKTTALLRVLIDEASGAEFSSVTLAQDLSIIKLGQTVVSLSGGERTNVAIGIISAIDTATEGEGEDKKTIISRVNTDIGQTRLLFGSPLVDLFGEIIGIHTASAQGLDVIASFTPISVVRAQMAQFVETQ